MERPELMVTNGALAGKRFAVKEGGVRLGRSSSNDIPIPDERLSRNHCLFERQGESGICLTDLASANGTYLNGKVLGNDPEPLKVGDLVEAGSTVIRVVGDEPAEGPAAVDLGLGEAKPSVTTGRHRSPLANLLWVLVLLLAGAAIYGILVSPTDEAEEAPSVPVEEDPVLSEVFYEKVEATQEGIFRFALTLTADGVLSVTVDDVPKENRHLKKSQPLNERARAEIGEILAWKTMREIDREYVGVEPDPPALNSWSLRAVYSTRVRSVRVENMAEPEAFRVIREKLEAFSKNQLGVWALQYSRDKLIELAAQSIVLAQAKWEDRDVQHGNLFAAATAYREALFYLETVNPKPANATVAREGLKTAETELDKRYRDQRFLADRAINLGQWENAQRELQVLLEMVPDRSDDRHREASAKLVDVEKRMTKGGK